MANTNIDVGRQYSITTADNNNTLVLGDVSTGTTGAFMVHFVNDNTFSGTIDVKARGRGLPLASTVAFVGNIPYRKLYLNGASGDGTLVTTQITTNSLIIVPAPGLSVGLVVTCASGSGTLYVWPIEGATAY